MSTTGQGCCARCGAVLRHRGHSSGRRGQVWCDPCRRAGPDARRDLPAGFYVQEPLATALAEYDFRSAFRRIRMATGWSQQALAEVAGLDQSRISAIERGVRSMRDVALVAQVATRLGIPPVLLGFGATVGAAGGAGQKLVSWMDRRDFVQHVAALALSATGTAMLDIDRLIALLPPTDPAPTRRIGLTDVAAIEQATSGFVCQDHAYGSGMVRDAAVAHLHATLPLLNAQISPEVRPQLHLATARLAMQAGWMSFDVHQHDAARRLWLIALDIARGTEDHRNADLTTYVLYDMAIQAVSLGRPDEALRLVHLGHATAAGPRPVSGATLSCLANIQAKAHAYQGDAAECHRALGRATDQFSTIDPANRPPWGTHLDESLLASLQGTAYYALALANRDPQAARQAVPLLRQAVDGFGPDHARTQAVCLPGLAGAHALSGDIDTAVTVGHQAIDAVTTLHSPRAYNRLQDLNTTLEPLHTSAGIAELRDRLTSTAA